MELKKKQILTPPYKRVSATGVQEINVYLKEVLHRNSFVWFPLSWSWEWSIERGDYRGKLPNRVVGLVKGLYDVKLTSEQKSTIGNIARKHLLARGDYIIDFTNDFDWNAGDFGDFGSCFWDANLGAREIMEEEGVIAIRFYDEDGIGMGRAWLYKLSGTAWVLFNAYGLECSEAASVFAMKLGENTGDTWDYEQLDYLRINGTSKGFVYVNSYPQIICREGHDLEFSIDLDWDVPYGLCEACGDWVHEDNMYHDEEHCESYCYDCYETLLTKEEEERLVELEERLEQEMEEDFRDNANQAKVTHAMAQEAIRNSITAQLVAGQLCLGVDFQMGLSLL